MTRMGRLPGLVWHQALGPEDSRGLAEGCAWSKKWAPWSAEANAERHRFQMRGDLRPSGGKQSVSRHRCAQRVRVRRTQADQRAAAVAQACNLSARCSGSVRHPDVGHQECGPTLEGARRLASPERVGWLLSGLGIVVARESSSRFHPF